MATGPVTRTVTEIVIGPRRVTAVMLQNGPVGIPHYAETTEVITPAMANARGLTGRTVHQIATKASRDAKEVPVLHMTIRGHALPEGRPLPPPPMFHSTPLLALCRLSSDLPEPSSAHLSFNQSWSSLPPLDLGGCNARPIYSMGAPVQEGAPSVVGPSLPSTSVASVNFSGGSYKTNIQSHLRRVTFEGAYYVGVH